MSEMLKKKNVSLINSIKRKINRISGTKAEGNILRNMMKLVAGEGTGRIIGIITTPIITRIYSPSDMGVLAVFLSLIALVTPFGAFKYSLAIPISKNDKVASNLFASSLFLLLTSSAILFFALLLFGDYLLAFFSMTSIIGYWWLIPFAFLGIGIYDLLSQWAIRKKTFTPLAKTSVTQKIAGVFVKVGLGLLSIKPLGLLIGDLVGRMGGISTLIISFKEDIRENWRSVTQKKMGYTLKRYINFPLYRVPSQLLLAFAGNIPILYFAWKFGSDATGQIGLARTLLSIPITFIGYAVGKAFFSEIARMGVNNGAAIYNVTNSVVKKLFKISFIPFLVIVLFGPAIFKVIFGNEWYQSGIYARALSISLIAQFVYSPISDGVFNVFEKQSYVLLIEISRSVIVGTIFFIAYLLNWNALTTLVVYSCGLAIQYILSIYVVYKIIKNSNDADS